MRPTILVIGVRFVPGISFDLPIKQQSAPAVDAQKFNPPKLARVAVIEATAEQEQLAYSVGSLAKEF